MKRSKLGTISATIGIILGCLILLAGIGILSVGYTDVGGLWTKYIALQTDIVDAIIAKNSITAGNEYVSTISNKIIILYEKLPQNYRIGVLGGIFALLGIYSIGEGLICIRRKAKKSYLVFAIIDTIIFLAFAATSILLGIGGSELIILLTIIGIALLYGAAFPGLKVCGYVASVIKAKPRQKKIMKPTIANASYKSKDKKKADKKNKVKLTRKQKKLAKLAKAKGGEVGKNEKILSKPVAINTATVQSVGIQVKSVPTTQKPKAVAAQKKESVKKDSTKKPTKK